MECITIIIFVRLSLFAVIVALIKENAHHIKQKRIIMKTMSFWSKCLTLLCLASLGTGSLLAQGNGDADKTLSPYFVVISENPETDQLPLKETAVQTSISGSIADVIVRQVYVNSGKNPLEAVYTFPMSTRAAVYAMQMTIGTRVIRAQIEEKQKARAD